MKCYHCGYSIIANWIRIYQAFFHPNCLLEYCRKEYDNEEILDYLFARSADPEC
jgi:hypothetical protein